MAQPIPLTPDLDIRSQQVRLLETWNTYRAHIEDNTSYKFSNQQRPRPTQQLMTLVERAFASHTIEHCVMTLHELRSQLKSLFDTFENNIDSFDLLGAGSDFTRPHSETASLQSTNSSSPSNPTSTMLSASNIPTLAVAGLPSLTLSTLQFLPGSPSILPTSTSLPPSHFPLSERLQHDLISLPSEIFCGLLHHSQATTLLQDVLPTMFESTKRHYVMIIFDIIYLVWNFFSLLASMKTRFVLMVNYLLQANIISAAVHCILNTITQVISTASLSFLVQLFKGDENMIILFVQNYNILPVLKMRFQYCVNIDLLHHIQVHHPSLINSAEVSLRVKTPQEPLGKHHLQPLFDLLSLYLQIETAVLNRYDKHYVDNSFIYDCHGQMIYIIRYLQLLASQSSYLYHNPDISTSLPPSLQIPIAPTLYLYPNPLYFPISTPASLIATTATHTQSTASISMSSRMTFQRQPNASRATETTLHLDSGTQFIIDNGSKKSRTTTKEVTIHQPDHFHQTTAATSASEPISSKKNNKDAPSIPPTLPPSQARMLLLRPILQLTVDILELISQLSAQHDEIPDIFLYQNIGIIPTAIKLGVRFKLTRPLVSFSPVVKEYAVKQQ